MRAGPRAGLLLLAARDPNGLWAPLARTRVGLGTLPTGRQPPTVAQPAIAADVHQTLDVALYFRAQVALDLVVTLNDLAQPSDLILAEIPHALIGGDIRLGEDLTRQGPAHAVQVRQSRFYTPVARKVHACNPSQYPNLLQMRKATMRPGGARTGLAENPASAAMQARLRRRLHPAQRRAPYMQRHRFPLTLGLLVLRILANDHHAPMTLDDLALFAHPLHRRPDLHPTHLPRAGRHGRPRFQNSLPHRHLCVIRDDDR